MRDINFERNYNSFIRTPLVNDNKPINSKTTNSKTNSADFSELLQKQIQNNELTVSKHAVQRIIDRQINMTPVLVERLSSAVNKAKEKGIKDALIFSQDLAFIVNIPNNTVITAIDSKEMSENVFTKIDGAVML